MLRKKRRTYLHLGDDRSVQISGMLLTDVIAKCIHVFAEIVTLTLLFFKVNFDFMDVFLLLFSLFALITSDHCVNNGKH